MSLSARLGARAAQLAGPLHARLAEVTSEEDEGAPRLVVLRLKIGPARIADLSIVFHPAIPLKVYLGEDGRDGNPRKLPAAFPA